MIIDANAWLGHWPFRPLRHKDAPGLLRLMDAHAIDKAVVSSVHAIFYKNCQRANEELALETAQHRDRLIPFTTLNPTYPSWQRDLRITHEEFGFCGLRLFPVYHNYNLTDSASLELIQAATELGMPVALAMRVVDVRQRHWMDADRDVTLTEIAAVVRACPRTSFIILNGLGLESADIFAENAMTVGRVVTDLSRMTALLGNDLGTLIANYGADSVVFGSGIPFNYATPARLKLDLLDASMDDKQKIAWGNMAQILGL